MAVPELDSRHLTLQSDPPTPGMAHKKEKDRSSKFSETFGEESVGLAMHDASHNLFFAPLHAEC